MPLATLLPLLSALPAVFSITPFTHARCTTLVTSVVSLTSTSLKTSPCYTLQLKNLWSTSRRTSLAICWAPCIKTVFHFHRRGKAAF
ncbi:hypothetical protein BJ546DRAFT_970824 [Cryomyces antarcticus]